MRRHQHYSPMVTRTWRSDVNTGSWYHATRFLMLFCWNLDNKVCNIGCLRTSTFTLLYYSNCVGLSSCADSCLFVVSQPVQCWHGCLEADFKLGLCRFISHSHGSLFPMFVSTDRVNQSTMACFRNHETVRKWHLRQDNLNALSSDTAHVYGHHLLGVCVCLCVSVPYSIAF